MPDAKYRIPQGIARQSTRPIPLRWQRSQKLAGYYDPGSHSLIYQDAQGKELDRVELPAVRSTELTTVVR